MLRRSLYSLNHWWLIDKGNLIPWIHGDLPIVDFKSSRGYTKK